MCSCQENTYYFFHVCPYLTLASYIAILLLTPGDDDKRWQEAKYCNSGGPGSSPYTTEILLQSLEKKKKILASPLYNVSQHRYQQGSNAKNPVPDCPQPLWR